MRPHSHLIAAFLLAGSAMAYYMPVYQPIYIPPSMPSGPSYHVDVIDEIRTTREPGSDTLVKVGDTIGLLVTEPKVSDELASAKALRGWMDSLSTYLRPCLGEAIVPAAAAIVIGGTGSVDSLALKFSNGWNGSDDDNPAARRADTAGQLRKIGLERPTVLSGAKAVLVIGEKIVSRNVVPAGGKISKVADLQVGWGLWDPLASKWVAWGLVSLRRSKTDLKVYSSSEAADEVAKLVLDEAPVPSNVAALRRAERKSKYGGLLLGTYLRGGFHTSGDMRDMVKDWGEDYSLSEFDFGLEAGWYEGYWGIGVSLPITKSIYVAESYTDQYGESHSNSTKMFDVFAPSAEIVGLVPVGKGALTGALGFGYMSLKGESDFWGNSFDGSGYFWYPRLGYYIPGKYVYFATDLGLQLQKYDFGLADWKSTVFVFDLRFGLRLAHD